MRERDQREWEDPANWRGGWLSFYVSREDSRLWVPKRRPGFGWTINFGHPRAPLFVACFLAAIVLVAAGGAWFRQ